MPQRIQRKRTKGWRMPEGAVYVGRPGKWGNPFAATIPHGEAIHPPETRAALVEMYRLWLIDGVPSRDVVSRYMMVWSNGVFRRLSMPAVPRPERRGIRADLAGRDLACWCPLDQPCHADVLLEIANQQPAHLAADAEGGAGDE